MTQPKTCSYCLGRGKILINSGTGLTKDCPRGCKPVKNLNGTKP